MSDTQTVYVGRSHRSYVYHTDEECYKLPDDYRETTAEVLRPFYDECEYCQGRNLDDRKPPAEYFEFGGGP